MHSSMSVGRGMMFRMTTRTAALQADLDALTDAFESAMPAFDAAMAAAHGPVADAGAEPGDAVDPLLAAAGVDAELERMSGPGVMRVLEAAARLRRRVDAVLTRAADEVAKRSATRFGPDGLAKQHGYSSPARLVAAMTGGSAAEASKLLSVGSATRTRQSLAGQQLPPKHPHARVRLDGAALSLDAAALITGMLERAAQRADSRLLDPYEATLVAMAERAPLKVVSRAVALAESRLDADGVEPADEAMHDRRSVTFHEDVTGMFHFRGRLDPVTAAPIKAALDALVGDALRRRDGRHGDSGGRGDPVRHDGAERLTRPPEFGDRTAPDDAAPIIEDRRSIPQLQADALAQLARHALGCSGAPPPLASTTIVVRLTLDALREGLGTAEIDGIDRPIAATTARRLAADAELIPVVLGTDGAPLDLGRAARLFSRSQRLALGERDGGCASCGQNITYANAHHIEWWQRDLGRTDLDNGVLLCSHCHRQVHLEGWQIRATPTEIWFIPPPHIDPEQRPRQGGRARFDPTRRHDPTTVTAPIVRPDPMRRTDPARAHPAPPDRPTLTPQSAPPPRSALPAPAA